MYTFSGLGRINLRDVCDSIVSAVFVSIVALLYSISQASSFSLFAVDWKATLMAMANIAFITAVGVLATKLGTTKSGNFAGVIPVR